MTQPPVNQQLATSSCNFGSDAPMHRVLKWAFVAATIAWAVVLPLASAAAATPHAPAGEYAFAALAYAIGGIVCHQQSARSFHLWGVQLPVCARCTGIYAGAALSVVALGWRDLGRRSQRRFTRDPERVALRTRFVRGPQRIALVASGAPILFTLVFEWTTGVTPSNTIRALSGVPLGAAVAWVVLMAQDGTTRRAMMMR